MQILCTIDQAAALRRGIDAPSSTAQIEVDPSTLTQAERDVLAAILYHGHDARWLGIQTEPDGIVGARYADDGRDGGPSIYGSGVPTGPLVLERPDLDGLLEAIARLLEVRDQRHAERIAAATARRKSADASIRLELARCDGLTVAVTVGLTLAGHVAGHYESGVVTETLAVPAVPWVSGDSDGSADVRAEYATARERATADGAAIRAAAVERLRPRLAEVLAEREAAAVIVRTEYDALYARLPEALRARHGAGYAPEDEILRTIRRMIRSDAGYPSYVGWDDSEAAETLTDAQYARLVQARAAMPAGATCEALRVWQDIEACCADHIDAHDSDCSECTSERTAERIVARIRWTRGGVATAAIVELGD